MSIIKSGAELRNDYNAVSDLCRTSSEPVFITNDGKVDLVVMSIEVYEQLTGRTELHDLIQEGLDDISSGSTRPFSEAISDIRKNRK